MSIYIGLGMAIPGHEAANFTRKQDSLHALVVKRERSKQSLPYLLATQFCAGTVFGELLSIAISAMSATLWRC